MKKHMKGQKQVIRSYDKEGKYGEKRRKQRRNKKKIQNTTRARRNFEGVKYK